MTIAYQGAPGAFSHEACLAFAPGHVPIARATFEDVVEAVVSGATELGILPVENSAAGAVPGARELIEGATVRLASEHDLPVRMHLLALPGAGIDEIVMISSHPMALSQCSAFLREMAVETRAASNTAVAAQSLVSSHEAVLGSEAAAAAYGLTILRRDVHDDAANVTRFCIFERAGE